MYFLCDFYVKYLYLCGKLDNMAWQKIMIYYGDHISKITSIQRELSMRLNVAGVATAEYGVLTVSAYEMAKAEAILDRFIPEWRTFEWWTNQSPERHNTETGLEALVNHPLFN